MGLNRNISLSAALQYKGHDPYWTYILHRIGGSALFIFFTMYILVLAGVDSVNAIFSNWLFQIFHAGLWLVPCHQRTAHHHP